MQKNAICDGSPTRTHEGTTYEKIMNLRPRDQIKELDGQFRFKAKSNAEKVIDSYQNNYPLNSVKNEDAFSVHLMRKNIKGHIKRNLAYVQKRSPRMKSKDK